MKQESCVRKKFKIAITGNIGTGKTTISKIIVELGFKVFQSDREVEKIYLYNDVKLNIALAFSDKIKNLKKPDGQIDKKLLSDHVFDNESELKKLENIIYPELNKQRKFFLESNPNEKALFFDIPLLFEKNLYNSYDKIIYLYTDESTKKKRVLERKNMTEEKIDKILKNQISDISKFEKFISLKINTNCTREHLKDKIEHFTNRLFT